MTITTNDDRDEYTASSGQTAFNYTFKIYASSDLNVYQTPSGQDFDDSTDLITGYTVAGVGASAGGSITLNTGATTGDRITIVSDVPSSRTTDYQVSGDFLPATVNEDFDRAISLQKQAEGIARRSLLFPQSQQNTTSLSLPSPVSGNFVKWKTDLSGLENHTFSANGIQSDVSVTDYIALRALTSSDYSDGQVVFVTNDGIAGDFVVKTGTVTDNGGTLIVFTDDSNRYVERLYSGAVNIQWFGALPSASAAVNTTAITNAIAAGEAIYTPEGSYSHNGITLEAQKLYFGDGMQDSKWAYTGSGNGVEYTSVPAFKGILRDMWIAGNGVDTARSLYIKNGYFNSFMQNVRVNDGVINVYLESSWTFTLDGCHIYGADNDDKGITQNNLYTDGWEAGVLNNTRLEDCLGDNIVIDQINGPATNFFSITGSTKIQRCNGRGIYAKVGQGRVHAYFERVNDDNLASDTITITGATQANPVVITGTNTLNNGDVVDISGVVGMTELNGNAYTVANVTSTTFELEAIDGTAFTAYTSGGTAEQFTAAVQFNEGGYSEVFQTYLTNSGANTRFINFNGNTINVQSSHQSSSGGARGLQTSNTTPQAVTIANRFFVTTPYDVNAIAWVCLDQTTELQLNNDAIGIGDPAQIDLATYALDVYAENKNVRFQGNTNTNWDFDTPANRRNDMRFLSAGVLKAILGRGDSDDLGDSVIYIDDTSNDATPSFSVDVTSGQVRMCDLPTSSAGLPTGAIWNNSGVVNIV